MNFQTLQSAPTKQRGFTLIEIMLVLVLIVVLAAAGLAAYQIQLRNFKVDKTALQMQQWLQAGQAYYADCGQWPVVESYMDPMLKQLTGEDPIDSKNCSTKYAKTYHAYMPPDSQYGIWQPPSQPIMPFNKNYYTMGPVCPPGNPACPPSERLFYVQTVIKDSPNAKVIGDMIAGRLPNGISRHYPASSVLIRAYVNTVPNNSGGGPGPGSGAYLVDMEIVRSGRPAQHIKPPACQPGFTPSLVSATSGIDAGKSGNNRQLVYLAQSDQTLDAKTGFITAIKGTDIYKDPSKKITPDLTVMNGDGATYRGLANDILLISACIPDTTIKPSSSNLTSGSTAGTRY